MKRYGPVVIVRPEKISEYTRLHASVWPEVLETIKACHIQNYSIYLRKLADGRHYLFRYFENTGSDFAARHGEDGSGPNNAKVVGRLQTLS